MFAEALNYDKIAPRHGVIIIQRSFCRIFCRGGRWSSIIDDGSLDVWGVRFLCALGGEIAPVCRFFFHVNYLL